MGTFDREPTGECMNNCTVVRHCRSKIPQETHRKRDKFADKRFRVSVERHSVAILVAEIFLRIVKFVPYSEIFFNISENPRVL